MAASSVVVIVSLVLGVLVPVVRVVDMIPILASWPPRPVDMLVRPLATGTAVAIAFSSTRPPRSTHRLKRRDHRTSRGNATPRQLRNGSVRSVNSTSHASNWDRGTGPTSRRRAAGRAGRPGRPGGGAADGGHGRSPGSTGGRAALQLPATGSVPVAVLVPVVAVRGVSVPVVQVVVVVAVRDGGVPAVRTVHVVMRGVRGVRRAGTRAGRPGRAPG